jgi:hypothetical protein
MLASAIALCLAIALPSPAALAGESGPLFEADTPIVLELKGPLRRLIRQKRKRKEMAFTLTTPEGVHDVMVRARGKSRMRVCSFPPLRVSFADDATSGTLFHGEDNLKLVTHCLDSNAAQANTILEYAAYRIFNIITEIGYRVRLAHISYSESDAQSPTDRNFGFLIESRQALADRLGGKFIQAPGVALGALEPSHLASVFLFQYLIGNTDWSLVAADEPSCCHNGDLLDIGKHRFYVPYDFDLAGLVNASYAYPDPTLRIRRVTQRVYRGFCLPDAVVESALNDVMARWTEITQMVDQLPVEGNDARELSDFLEGFHRLATGDRDILNVIKRSCLRSAQRR